MLRSCASILVIAFLFSPWNVEAGKVYLWKDAQGVPHISDVPPKITDGARDVKQMEYQGNQKAASGNTVDGAREQKGDDPLKQPELTQKSPIDPEIEAEINRIKSRLDAAAVQKGAGK